jgi:3-oxoacyl-[acyl-carrier-protein] synthase-1
MTPAERAPVGVVAQGLACAAGVGLDRLAKVLAAGESALAVNTFTHSPLPAWLGLMTDITSTRLPPALQDWDCRATRAAWLGLQADDFISAAQSACNRHGATRVGLVLGTSASTVGASEQAYQQLASDGGFPAALRQESLNTIHALAHFVQQATGVQGPCVTVSTACSSSAKAFAQAQRWLHLGLVDAVVVAGVDALCDSVLFGFAALGLVSAEPCRPFAANRQGISIGEAAGFALLERGQGDFQLLGCGEANDAHHMSSPHPQGRGAEQALDAALAQAQLHAHDIDLVSLHGTATPQNDAVEAALVARRYRADVHASATKACTGHTMGAAGILAALGCGLALRHGLRAGTAHTPATDPALGPVFARQLQLSPQVRPVQVAACHAFGFGGNNAVLLFGRSGA